MFQLDIARFFDQSNTLWEKIKGRTHNLLSQSFLKTEKAEPYIFLRITPADIQFQVVSKQFIEDEQSSPINDIENILKTLDKYNHLPLCIVLSQWDISIKHLDLKHANLFDKYHLQRSFLKGEFKQNDIVYCLQSSVVKELCRFVAIHHNYVLDHTLLALSKLKNPLIGIRLEENLLLRYVVDYLPQPIDQKDWRLIFIRHDDYWQLLVGHGYDLIISRMGKNEKGKQYLDYILETIRYLPRLGLQNKNHLTLYAEKDLFSKIHLAEHNLEVIEFYNIEENLFHQTLKESIYDVVKRFLNMNFVPQHINHPAFFWQKLNYNSLRYSMLLLLPACLMLLGASSIYSLKNMYYKHSIKQIESQLETLSKSAVSPQTIAMIEGSKKYYQENPVLLMKNLSEFLGKKAIAEKIEWSYENQKLSIKMDLTIFGAKDKILSSKDSINTDIDKAFPKITREWKQKSKNKFKLLLTKED